jgi:hypothetical protein
MAKRFWKDGVWSCARRRREGCRSQRQRIEVLGTVSGASEAAAPGPRRTGHHTVSRLRRRNQANKSKLGFSFEARGLITSSINADPLPIEDLNFTGEAILLKEYATYRSTSIHV